MKVLITPAITIAIITFQQYFLTGLSIDLSALTSNGEVLSNSINHETIQSNYNNNNLFNPKIQYSQYIEKIELLRNVTSFQQISNNNNDMITEQRRRAIESNEIIVNENESMSGGGLRNNRNLQKKVCKGTKKHIIFQDTTWYTELKNSKGHFAFRLANYGLRFKIENTKCGSKSKAQEAWAYIHFEVKSCPVLIKDIIVLGLVNQQNEVTDYLNVFIDGKHVLQYSAYPKWEDDLINGIEPATCSMGKPKKQMAFESITLQPGKHDFAVQIATNEAKIAHQGAFYDVKFIV